MDSPNHREGRYGVPYGTGNCTYWASIAKVALLSIFQFFFNLHILPQKQITRIYRKKNFKFFFLIYTTYRQKKLHAFTAKKNYMT